MPAHLAAFLLTVYIVNCLANSYAGESRQIFPCCMFFVVLFLRQDLAIARAGLKLMAVLPQPLECWDYRLTLPCPVHSVHPDCYL